MKIKHQLMKSLKTYFLLSMACLLFACACTKEEIENLPPATQTGANTFGCLVNGKAFVSSKETYRSRDIPSSLIYPLTLTKRYSEGGVVNNIRIEGRSFGTNKTGDIYIYIYDELSVEEKSYSTDVAEGFSSFRPNYSFMSVIHSGAIYYSQENSGSITLTRVDYENRIYSGTFSAELKHEDGRTIKITEGRFDINQNTVKTQYE